MSKQKPKGKNQLGAEQGADAKRAKVAGGDSDSSEDSSSSSQETSKVSSEVSQKQLDAEPAAEVPDAERSESCGRIPKHFNNCLIVSLFVL